MSIFIENLIKYLSYKGIKRSYLSIRSGISEDKISKLLNGKQKITADEMEILSEAIGKPTSFFLEDDFAVPEDAVRAGVFAFYAGSPGQEQVDNAMKLMQFIECVDEVFSSELWYKSAGDFSYGI